MISKIKSQKISVQILTSPWDRETEKINEGIGKQRGETGAQKDTEDIHRYIETEKWAKMNRKTEKIGIGTQRNKSGAN